MLKQNSKFNLRLQANHLVLFIFIIFYFTNSAFCQTQIGNDIYGSESSQEFGFNVEMSEDGDRIIAQSFKGDIVRAFELQNNEWIQLGGDIFETVPNNSRFAQIYLRKNHLIQLSVNLWT